MKDSIRESFSYFGLYRRMFAVKKAVKPKEVSFGQDKNQYFLYYEPEQCLSDKVVVWVHGGGWNAGTPKDFDFVGQCLAKAGYRFVSLGYRLSPKNKYPSQIEDVCTGFNAAIRFLKARKIPVSKIVVSGPYRFTDKDCLSVKILLNQFFEKGYDRSEGEPYSLMDKSDIPMLLIQSEHDGLIQYSCAVDFYEKALETGNTCELYPVEDKKNTHSWYTAGMFLETREENRCLDKFLSWVEVL